MPEVGEVAHAVANLKRNVLGKVIKRATFNFDDIVFTGLKSGEAKKPKKPSHYLPEIKFSDVDQIENRLLNTKIKRIGRHGKYFWLRAEKSPNVGLLILLHFGMTGWIKFKDLVTHFIQMEGGGYKKVFKMMGMNENGEKVEELEDKEEKEETVKVDLRDTSEDWPPRFNKFELELDGNVMFSFVDPRRLARVRFYELSDAIASDSDMMNNIEQLSKLGPDYSKTNIEVKDFIKGDPDPSDHGKKVPTLQEFHEFISKKPNATIKPFLLKQEYFSGIGNWMADEVLFLSRIYPEDTLGVLSEDDIERLYLKIIEVSKISVELEAEASKFPKNWLMLYRWGKKSKKTFEGHEVKFLSLGGRTSCYVPELQKKKPKKVKRDEEKSNKKKAIKDDSALDESDSETPQKRTRKKRRVKTEES